MVLRTTTLAICGALAIAACSSDPVDPRLIPGGGIGDGPIDGVCHVHLIDETSGAPVVGAAVAVGDITGTTDTAGLFTAEDVDGPQTVVAQAGGYRAVVWAGVDGANVTVPLSPAAAATPPYATLSGTIAGFTSFTVPTGHLKAAIVGYSKTARLGDPDNAIETPSQMNMCVASTPTSECNWTVHARVGQVGLLAAIVDFDSRGTSDPSDDVTTVLGYAALTGITTTAGVAQSGLALPTIAAGNLVDITVDLGAPPPGLPDRGGVVEIDLGDDGVFQLPLSITATRTTMLAPALAAFPGATYTLLGMALDGNTSPSANSLVLRPGQTASQLAAGAWLVPPTGATATPTRASWNAVAGALVHVVSYQDSAGTAVLDITMFDAARTAIDIPPAVAPLAAGAARASVTGIAADFDVTDFQLDEDFAKITGAASQPVAIAP